MAFTWVPYYKELAQKLVQYRDKREELLDIIRGIDREYIDFLQKDGDGTKITDIHPFAIYSIFSRLFLVPKKQKILEYLKTKLNLTSPIPTDFDGIPSVNPQNSFWGMPWNDNAKKEIEENWDLFCCAVNENFDEDEFCKYFDKVISQQGAKWNVTQALFRMNPDKFISLDGNSREYLGTENITVFNERDLSGKKYLSLLNDVKENVNKHSIKEKNFYELSHNAWKYGNEKVNYWIIAPGTNAAKWDEYSKSGEIGIGWDELGPLSNYKKIEQVRDKYLEIWHPDNKDFASDAPNQIWNFYKNIQIGDVIIARKGVKQIIGLGKVTSDYFYDDKRDEFFHLRKVNWEKIGEWKYPGQSTRDTVHILKPAIVKEILKNMNADENAKTIELTELLEANKNLILHGAPGTGKTYTAKDIAAQIICEKPFSEIEKNSDEEKAFNEQTEFVQFHPSYDYSDFVEGLRPIEGENSGDVGFERKDGVFKEFCERALKSTTSGGNDNFDDAWKSFVNELNESNSITIETKKKKQFTVELNQNGDGLIDKQENYTRFYNYAQLYNVYRNLPGVPNGGHDNYRQAIINYMKEHNGLDDYKPGQESTTEKKYIFIIDEINRGEMSKIFGELFFSIDPDYRGTKGKVRTQYANMVKTKNAFDYRLNSLTYGNFFVPENVYIIGTMNDIDRSVESMDFAMRRRFTFVELFADQCLGMLNNITCTDGIITVDEIKTKMKSLNSKIEREPGLSTAYHIGGSYFSKLKKYENKTKSEAFEALWNNHLNPLITDYLRGIPNLDKKLENYKADYLNAGIYNPYDSEGKNA